MTNNALTKQLEDEELHLHQRKSGLPTPLVDLYLDFAISALRLRLIAATAPGKNFREENPDLRPNLPFPFFHSQDRNSDRAVVYIAGGRLGQRQYTKRKALDFPFQCLGKNLRAPCPEGFGERRHVSAGWCVDVRHRGGRGESGRGRRRGGGLFRTPRFHPAFPGRPSASPW